MMHTAEDIRAEYRRLDALTGADTSGIPITISARLVNHYGLCKFRRAGRRFVPAEIVVARFLLGEEEAFFDTIRHEYAHAVVCQRTGARHGHDEVWKSLAAQIGASPSSRAASCGGFEQRRAEAVRYCVRCETCGATIRYVRRTAFVRAVESGQGGSYRCRCGGREFTLLSPGT